MWEKVQKEEQRKRAERIAAEASPAQSDSDEGCSPPAPADSIVNVAPLAGPEAGAIQKIKLVVRGEEGDLKLQARLSTTTSSICRHYCHKYNIDGSRAENMKLYFDGEPFGPDTEIRDLDLEDGDLVDVR